MSTKSGQDHGQLVVVDGRVAKVEHCDEDYRQDDPSFQINNSRAVLLVDLDAYAWLAPDRSHVFIPLGVSFASLENVCVSVHAPWPRPVALESVSLHVWGNNPECNHDFRFEKGHTDAYPSLRVGDTFVWGKHTADVVRIVNDRPPVDGWLELVVR